MSTNILWNIFVHLIVCNAIHSSGEYVHLNLNAKNSLSENSEIFADNIHFVECHQACNSFNIPEELLWKFI